MKRYLIAGNWKMNSRRQAAAELARAVVDGLKRREGVEVALCPPAVYLSDVVSVCSPSKVAVGGQNLYPAEDGAYTGELNAAMLRDVGCKYVILGHSERRAIFGESDDFVNKKLHAALAAGLTPIVCVGETLEQRESGQTEDVVRGQLEGSLAGLSSEQMAGSAIAYEPVWAIGTGKTATPQQAEAVHAFIRGWLADKFGAGIAKSVILQYGGSVKADNAAELLKQPNIDGALVGGASLKADGFLAICHAAG